MILCFALFYPSSFAAEPLPPELQAVGVEEHLGRNIDLEKKFVNEKGESIALKSFFDGKRPVLLTLVYYNCPNLCNLLLNGLLGSLKNFAWTPGEQFQLVTISIDPAEKNDLALQKKETYLKGYGRPQAEKGWHFLVSPDNAVKKLAEEIGFKYKYDEEGKQYAHGAVLFILTPDGKLSRYLYGIEFNPRDLKLSLLEASEGKVGTLLDRFLMFCYHYDPKGRKYALYATNAMKLGGGAIIVAIAVLLISLSKNRRTALRK